MLTFSNFISWRKNVKREIQGPTPSHSWFSLSHVDFFEFYLMEEECKEGNPRTDAFTFLVYFVPCWLFRIFPLEKGYIEGNPGTDSFIFLNFWFSLYHVGFLEFFSWRKNVKREIQGPTPSHSLFTLSHVDFLEFFSWRKNLKREIQGPVPSYSWFFIFTVLASKAFSYEEGFIE